MRPFSSLISMLTSGFSLCAAVFLTLMLWLGAAAQVTAQTLLPASLNSTARVSSLSRLLPAEIAAMGKPLFHFSGQRPDHLGAAAGQLTACPATPNCVNSQASPSDSEHFIQPIGISNPDRAMADLKEIIESLDRTQIITAQPDYLYAEFTSAIMGFVDDVEFALDRDASVIQVRSASRLGESDLGVNRKRIETIRQQFADRSAS